MKVLRVMGGIDPAFGGPSVSAVASSLALARAGAHVTLVFPSDAASPEVVHEVVRPLAAAGADVHTFELSRAPWRRGRRWGVSGSMTTWLVRNVGRYEVVHSHGAWTMSTLVATLAARLRGRHVVLTPHESLTEFDVRKSHLLARVAKRVLRRLYWRTVDVFVFTSELERLASVGRASVRTTVIPHPAEGWRARRSQGRGDRALSVGFLGRLDPKKNLRLVLEALCGLDHVELLVAGTGGPEIDASLRARAEALGLQERVNWLGFVSGQARESFFSSIDVLALPSAFECFGMSAAEAIVRGVPVLVSRNAGIADLVARHRCGLVVQADCAAIRDALNVLQRRGSTLEALRAGSEHARAELSPARHAERLRAAYRGQCGEERPHAVGASICRARVAR